MQSGNRRGDPARRSTTIAVALGGSALALTLASSGAARADQPEDLGRPATDQAAPPYGVPAAAPPGDATTANEPVLRPGDRRLVDGEQRLRLAPRVGGGIGFVTGKISPFPHTIGLTEIGGEVSYEVIPWGGWIQGTFESSGEDGKWTAPSIAAGFSYRLFGDGIERTSVLFRGGAVWEAWHASSTACSVYLFFPSGCVSLPPRNPDGSLPVGYKAYDDNGQDVGLLAGVRLEVPLRFMYLAFDGSFVPTVDLSETTPTATFAFRFAMLIGFRDQRTRDEKKGDTKDNPDNRYRNRAR